MFSKQTLRPGSNGAFNLSQKRFLASEAQNLLPKGNCVSRAPLHLEKFDFRRLRSSSLVWIRIEKENQ